MKKNVLSAANAWSSVPKARLKKSNHICQRRMISISGSNFLIVSNKILIWNFSWGAYSISLVRSAQTFKSFPLTFSFLNYLMLGLGGIEILIIISEIIVKSYFAISSVIDDTSMSVVGISRIMTRIPFLLDSIRIIACSSLKVNIYFRDILKIFFAVFGM